MRTIRFLSLLLAVVMFFMASRMESGGFPWIAYLALVIHSGPITQSILLGGIPNAS